MIVIDKREPDEIVNHIFDCPIWEDYSLSMEFLLVGDFQFRFQNGRTKQWNTVAIWERKTWSDLISSMSKKSGGRIFKQMVRAQACGVPVGLLVTGEKKTWSWEIDPLDRRVLVSSDKGSGGYQSGWALKSVEGLKLTLQDRGIRVVEIPNPTDLPYYLRWLHDHYRVHQNDTDSFWKADSSVPVAMLDMIPGIGPELAERLHSNLDPKPGSLNGVIEAEEGELVKLLGPKLGKVVYRKFH